MGPRSSKNGLCRTRDIPDTIISKEERSQPHNHANHMLWGWERFHMNLQNFVPDTQVDIQWVLIIYFRIHVLTRWIRPHICSNIMLSGCQISYINLQGFGNVGISEVTMGHNNYSFWPMFVQALVVLKVQGNKSGLPTIAYKCWWCIMKWRVSA